MYNKEMYSYVTVRQFAVQLYIMIIQYSSWFKRYDKIADTFMRESKSGITFRRTMYKKYDRTV